MNEGDSSEQDDESETSEDPPTRVSGIVVLVFVTVTVVLAMCVAIAVGTLWAAASQTVAGWAKLSPLHVLAASVATAFIAALAVATISLTSSLHELRNSLSDDGDLPIGLLRRLIWQNAVEEAIDEAPTRRRRRAQRRH